MKKDSFNITIKSNSLCGLRKINQDAMDFWKNDDNSCIAIVADGIGSLPNSEKCSKLICNVFINNFKNKKISICTRWFRETLKKCQKELIDYSNKELNGQNIGSTLALAIIKNSKLFIYHIGDTRIYLIRGRKVKLLTQDHNYKTFLTRQNVSKKVLKAALPKWKALTNFIDVKTPHAASFEANAFQLKEDDYIWLSSDGCYDYITNKDILKIIHDQQTSLAQKTALLNSLALSNNSGDNLSNIIIKVW